MLRAFLIPFVMTLIFNTVVLYHSQIYAFIKSIDPWWKGYISGAIVTFGIACFAHYSIMKERD